jgi:hypothetical protein
MVADAVAVEAVSTPKFPANREINREFCQIRSLCEILKANTRAISKAFNHIPYATEQGIISAEQGIVAQEQGILPTKSEIIIGSGFRYTQVSFELGSTSAQNYPTPR